MNSKHNTLKMNRMDELFHSDGDNVLKSKLEYLKFAASNKIIVIGFINIRNLFSSAILQCNNDVTILPSV